MVTNATEMSKKYSKQPEGSPLDLLEKKLEKVMQDSHGISPPCWKLDEILHENHAIHALETLKRLGYAVTITKVVDDGSEIIGWTLEWSIKEKEELQLILSKIKSLKLELKKQSEIDSSTKK